MFEASNRAGMEAIVFFLLHTLDPPAALAEFKCVVEKLR